MRERHRYEKVLRRFADAPELGEAIEILFMLRQQYDNGDPRMKVDVLAEVDAYLGRKLEEPRGEVRGDR